MFAHFYLFQGLVEAAVLFYSLLHAFSLHKKNKKRLRCYFHRNSRAYKRVQVGAGFMLIKHITAD